MSQGILTLTLDRDGPNTPWGFRLQGGSDLDQPLTIQRVFLGSPSEGELHRGDVIMRIGGRDANRLTHQEAHDIIVKSGNTLKLVVQRLAGGACSSVTTPGTPNPMDTGHPLANAVSPAFQPKPAGFFVSSTPTTPIGLPTTKIISEYQTQHPEPQTFADYERQEYMNEQQKEHDIIQNQAYRTVQLVFPKAKPRHDIPIGSYLRHVHDPNWKKPTPSPNRIYDAMMLAKETVKGAGFSPASLSPGRTPTPDSGISGSNSGSKVLHRQYNTPINMYSKQSLADTLQGQTGILFGQTGTKAGTKIQKASDITLSPTYQMLQQEEKNKQPKEHKPIHHQLYTIPDSKSHDINAFGMPKDKINQSGSFNTLTTKLLTGQSSY
ncbi:PDZ and LIM domain protein 3-like isoform X2 [Tachypleus tridentatus]|uniref:PDZ and LIM domain protein 3-like isoform X2 n=2 Tax=Tachypleus tridentatus TaxID=6853 RepID=UPI003FCF6DD7